jgi:hypothetical protein
MDKHNTHPNRSLAESNEHGAQMVPDTEQSFPPKTEVIELSSDKIKGASGGIAETCAGLLS